VTRFVKSWATPLKGDTVAPADKVTMGVSEVTSVPILTSISNVWFAASGVASPVCSGIVNERISVSLFRATVTVTTQSCVVIPSSAVTV